MESFDMLRRPGLACWGASGFAAAAFAVTLTPAAASTEPVSARAPAYAAQRAHRASSRPLLFVPNGAEGINIYDLHNPLKHGTIMTIKNGLVGIQYGMATDTAGNLYVVNDNEDVLDQEYVTVYAPPYTGAPVKLTGIVLPLGLAVDKTGNVYVATCGSYCGSTPAGIYVYPPGATQPMSEITSPLFKSLEALTIDSAGNLYAANYDPVSFGGSVLQIPAGTTTAHDMHLKGLGRAWGVAVNAAGDVYVSCDNSASYVIGFKAGKTAGSALIDSYELQYALEALQFGPDGNLYVPLFNGVSNQPGELVVYHGNKQIEEIPQTGQFVMGVATFPNPAFGG
jgi:hypothetical protein